MEIYIDKDPTLETLARQEALKTRGLYDGQLDNWDGPRTEDAQEAFRLIIDPPEDKSKNLHRDINAAGIELIKHFEGCFLTSYQDSVGVWTIGWGHTGLTHRDGSVHHGITITAAEAERLLHHDMDNFEGRVEKYIGVALNDDEFAALVSFDFNTGGIAKSTLRRKLNAGDREGAANELLRWDKAGGRTLAGLTRRRKSERRLFLSQSPAIVV